MRNRNEKAELFEGRDIVSMLAQGVNVDDVIDDELTKGRIRTICIQMKYGTKRPREIAEYYDLPVDLIKDIRDGRIFGKITRESYEDKDLFKSSK